MASAVDRACCLVGMAKNDMVYPWFVFPSGTDTYFSATDFGQRKASD